MNSKVSWVQEVAKFGTNYFLLKIKFLAESKRDLLQNSQLRETDVSCGLYLQA